MSVVVSLLAGYILQILQGLASREIELFLQRNCFWSNWFIAIRWWVSRGILVVYSCLWSLWQKMWKMRCIFNILLYILLQNFLFILPRREYLIFVVIVFLVCFLILFRVPIFLSSLQIHQNSLLEDMKYLSLHLYVYRIHFGLPLCFSIVFSQDFS